MEFNQGLLVSGWIGLHLFGLLSAWATRLATGSRLRAVTQLAFFALLACLSCAAWWSHQLELGLWVPTGFTIGAMLLLAVTDLRPAVHSHPELRPASSSGLY